MPTPHDAELPSGGTKRSANKPRKGAILSTPLIRHATASFITFDVDPSAKVIDVKAAVEKLLKVKVADVRLSDARGAAKKRFSLRKGKRRDWRTAYVRLKEGYEVSEFAAPTAIPSSVKPEARSKRHTQADFLSVATDDVSALVRAIEAGLPITALDQFQSRSTLSIADVVKLLRIPPRTLARRRDEGRLSAEESDRLVSISRLFADATNLFAGDVAAAVEWLSKPLAALGQLVPLEIAGTEAGCHEVERVIQQLEHGVFP